MGIGRITRCNSVLPSLHPEAITITLVKGPQAASYLQSLTSYDLRSLTFGKSAYVPIEGFNLHVARGGYTGEDGFEVHTQSLFSLYSHSHPLLRSPSHPPKPLKWLDSTSNRPANSQASQHETASASKRACVSTGTTWMSRRHPSRLG